MRHVSPKAAFLAAVTLVLMAPVVASAGLPSTSPGNTDMVDGPVRAIVQASADTWVGGRFTHVLNHARVSVATVSDLAAFTSGGGLDGSVHRASFSAASGPSIIYDMSVGPGGSLYVAGTFDHVDGQPRTNVAAINPSTGNLLPFSPVIASSANSILATSSAVFVGTRKLLSFQKNGSPTPGYFAPSASTVPSLREHKTAPSFRDIVRVANTLVAACTCDGMTDRHGSHLTKAVVKIQAGTGDLIHWTPAKLPHSGAAFGISVIVRNFPGTKLPTVYLGAGGSDFVAAYGFVNGHQRWREDVSGSAQAVAWWQGALIVGGHFDWTQKPHSGWCGDDVHPNPRCYHSPRLVALGARAGHVLLNPSGKPWNPGICCHYNGIWAVRIGSGLNSLHVGGEFSRAGGTWSYNHLKHRWEIKNAPLQFNYARFKLP